MLCVALTGGLPLYAETKIVETGGSGLVIESKPPAAKVFIDGIERGLTPLLLDGIGPGVYALRVTKDWYDDWTARITVPARGRLEAYIDLSPAMGTITVNIKEDGREFSGGERIFLNGVETGAREFDAPEGWRTVKVSAFGREAGQKSVFVVRGEKINLDFELKRAAFTLSGLRVSRSVLKPAGIGAQGILAVDFTVSAAGAGRFVVLNEKEQEVFSAPLGEFEQAEQRYVWDGRDGNGEIPADGVYMVRIEAEGDEGLTLSSVPLAVRIDSTLDEGPLSLGSGLPGLFFVPVSGARSGGTFQVEAGLVFGKAPGEERGFDTLPFSAGLSLTPFDGWQFAAAVNARPGRYGGIGPAAAASVKKEFLRPAGLVPGLAASAVYGWVEGDFLSAFGITTGLQLNAPLSWRLGRRFSLHFAPALLWTGGGGYPDEPPPRLVAAGGLLCRFRLVSAAFSFRTIITFSGEQEEFCPAAFSAELRFTPPRTGLSIGLLAGSFLGGGGWGGFGGLSVGYMF